MSQVSKQIASLIHVFISSVLSFNNYHNHLPCTFAMGIFFQSRRRGLGSLIPHYLATLSSGSSVLPRGPDKREGIDTSDNNPYYRPDNNPHYRPVVPIIARITTPIIARITTPIIAWITPPLSPG